jgi:transcription antitermination factor NusG
MDATNWYALYTRSRFEKKVFNSLTEKGIESFLPLQKTLRQWKDRKKWVQEPLIRSYCFVKVNRKSYFIPLTVSGVVKYIWFNQKPAAICEEEIALLKSLSLSSYKVDTLPTPLSVGQKVKVIAGILNGYEGEVLQLNGKHKVLFRIKNLPVSAYVEIPNKYLQVL